MFGLSSDRNPAMFCFARFQPLPDFFFRKLQAFFSGDIIEDDGLPIASMGRLYIYLHVLRFYQLKTHQL